MPMNGEILFHRGSCFRRLSGRQILWHHWPISIGVCADLYKIGRTRMHVVVLIEQYFPRAHRAEDSSTC